MNDILCIVRETVCSMDEEEESLNRICNVFSFFNVRYNDALFMLWFGLKYPHCTNHHYRYDVSLETKRMNWDMYQRELVLMF